MGYNDLVSIYNDNKLSGLYIAVYSLSIGIAILLAFYHYLKQVDDDGHKVIKGGITFDNFKNLLRKMLGGILITVLFPFAISFIHTGVSEISDSVPGAKETSGLIDGPVQQYVQRMEEETLKKVTILGVELAVPKTPMDRFDEFSEEMILSTLSIGSRYLYGFALGAYFMWLIVVEAFVPFAALGFFFKETRSFTESILRHFIAANLVPIFLYLANVISVAAYDLYTNSTTTGSIAQQLAPTMTVLVTGVVFLFFRIYLYKKAFDFAMKVV